MNLLAKLSYFTRLSIPCEKWDKAICLSVILSLAVHLPIYLLSFPAYAEIDGLGEKGEGIAK